MASEIKKKERAERREAKLIEKQKLQFIKNIRMWFSDRYKNFVEDIFNNKFDEEDVMLYLSKEDSINIAIERIKRNQEELKKREVYEAIVNNNKPLLKRLLEECKTNIVLYSEELERTHNWIPFSQKEIQSKNKKISKLKHNIEETKLLISKLMEKSGPTESKKKGRPSKEESLNKKVENFITEDEKNDVS